MRSSKLKNNRNLAIPGDPMSQPEFEALIKEAEKGPFYSAEELSKKMELWKKSLKK